MLCRQDGLFVVSVSSRGEGITFWARSKISICFGNPWRFWRVSKRNDSTWKLSHLYYIVTFGSKYSIGLIDSASTWNESCWNFDQPKFPTTRLSHYVFDRLPNKVYTFQTLPTGKHASLITLKRSLSYFYIFTVIVIPKIPKVKSEFTMCTSEHVVESLLTNTLYDYWNK